MNPTINSMILSLPAGLGQSVQCPDGRVTMTGLTMTGLEQGVVARQVEVRLLLTLAEMSPALEALLAGGVGGSVEALQSRREGGGVMSAHTPGPWAVWQDKSESGSNYWRIRTAPEKYGLQDNLGGYCGEANARLIAAAPEMLAALQAIARAVNDPCLATASSRSEGQ